MLSQFTPEGEHDTLGSLISFPKDVYPVGRLDHDSEGLLLLTNDKAVNARLLNPKRKHSRTYWAQVEGIPSEASLLLLMKGITINLKGTLYRSLPLRAEVMESLSVPERIPSVNYLKHPTTSWVQLTLREGKNRQIRKMMAKVGHPVLRLIRFAIGKITIEKMLPSDVVVMERNDFYARLDLLG